MIEAFVPDVSRYDRGQRVQAREVGVDRIQFEVATYDWLTQVITTTQVRVNDGNVKLYPVNIRFAFLSELDLMARLAGFELEHRWSDWERSPFTAASRFHVSVWGRG